MILIEIFIIDPLLWGNGFKTNVSPKKSDKPASTIIWCLLVIFTGFMVQFVVMDNWMLSYVALALAIRFSLFDYIINLSNVGKVRQKLTYLGHGKIDKLKAKVPFYFRLFIEVWVLIVGIMQYLYLSGRIYQEYPIIFDLPVFN